MPDHLDMLLLPREELDRIELERISRKLNGEVTPENYPDTQAEYFAERYARLKTGEPTWMVRVFRSPQELIDQGITYGHWRDGWKVAELSLAGQTSDITITFKDELIKVDQPTSLIDAMHKIEALA